MMDMNSLFAKPMLKYVLLPLLVAAAAALYKYAPWIKEDNPVEEHVELLLHKATGEDIDLSPDSPESK